MPSPQEFAALARSSPWRWSNLRFTMCWSGMPHQHRPFRAYLRRPDALRVENMDGTVRQIVRDLPGAGWAANAPQPTFRADGLVAARPPGSMYDYDAPMYQNYFFVAALDPRELADGQREFPDGQREFPDGDGTPASAGALHEGGVIRDVTEVRIGGRAAWQATVTPSAHYEPRCGCCSLMRDRETDLLEWAGDPADVLLAEYPTAYRVRLDVGTAVCTLTEALDGTVRGQGHEILIEAVDEEMPDELFVEPAPQTPRPTDGPAEPAPWPGGAGGAEPLRRY